MLGGADLQWVRGVRNHVSGEPTELRRDVFEREHRQRELRDVRERVQHRWGRVL